MAMTPTALLALLPTGVRWRGLLWLVGRRVVGRLSRRVPRPSWLRGLGGAGGRGLGLLARAAAPGTLGLVARLASSRSALPLPLRARQQEVSRLDVPTPLLYLVCQAREGRAEEACGGDPGVDDSRLIHLRGEVGVRQPQVTLTLDAQAHVGGAVVDHALGHHE